MKYSIYRSDTGELLLNSIELPEDRVENVSSDSDLGFQNAIELYRVNTPNDDLNEPLTLPVSDGKRESSLRFSFRVALACAFLGAIAWLSFLLGCAVAFWRHGGGQ